MDNRRKDQFFLVCQVKFDSPFCSGLWFFQDDFIINIIDEESLFLFWIGFKELFFLFRWQ